MSKIGQIRALVRNGLYYLTEHADDEAITDGFDIYDKGKMTGFWDGEHCEYCNGLIVEKTIDLPRKVGERYILVRNVPAGVCAECGTRYYAANVLKTMEEIVRGRIQAEQEIPMAVYSLVGSVS